MASGADGLGVATIAEDGTVLDTWFLERCLNKGHGQRGTSPLTQHEAEARFGDAFIQRRADPIRNVQVVAVRTTIADLEEPPTDIYDLYLRLHLLSARLVLPNSINLDEMWAMACHDVAWTSLGPCAAKELEAVQMRVRCQGATMSVSGIFPFPPMLDYVQPSGVRIADASRVFLGAYLAAGTCVAPEGFCGMNAGCLGPCMVEGRIMPGVVVGAGTDIGGGASIMGTTSGGGKHVVRVGERCLLGANSGIGISLGNDCIVEAGCYVTAGALVRNPEGATVKAIALSGRDGLLFRRNSATGVLEALEGANRWGGLNPVLHRSS